MSTDDQRDREERERITLIEPAKPTKFWRNVWSNFLTGVVVFAPLSITIYLVWTFVNFVDDRVLPLIPDVYNPENYLPVSVPGVGVIFFFLFVAGLGALTKNLFGRQLFKASERFVDRMPVVRSIYNTLRQIVDTIFARGGKDSFDRACLIEYPRKGIWAIAFVSTDASGEIRERRGEDVYSVFLPTTPNPTSGFLLFLPKSDVVILDMSVEDAAKLVISAGLVVPEYDGTPGEAEILEMVERVEG